MAESRKELQRRLDWLLKEEAEVRRLLQIAEARERSAVPAPPRILPLSTEPSPQEKSAQPIIPPRLDAEKEAAFGSRGLMTGGAIITLLGLVTLGTYLAGNFRVTKEVQWAIELSVCAILGAIGVWRRNHKGPAGQILLGIALCGANVSFGAACWDKELISATTLGIAFCVLSWTAFGASYLKKSEPLWVLGVIGAGAALLAGGKVEWLPYAQFLALAAPAAVVVGIHRWKGWAVVLACVGFFPYLALTLAQRFVPGSDSISQGFWNGQVALSSFALLAGWLAMAAAVIVSRCQEGRRAPSELYLLLPLLGPAPWEFVTSFPLSGVLGLAAAGAIYTVAGALAGDKQDRHLWIAGGVAVLAGIPWALRDLPGGLALLTAACVALSVMRFATRQPWALAGALYSGGLVVLGGFFALVGSYIFSSYETPRLMSQESLVACLCAAICLAFSGSSIRGESTKRKAASIAAWLVSAAGATIGFVGAAQHLLGLGTFALSIGTLAASLMAVAAYRVKGCSGSGAAAYTLGVLAPITSIILMLSGSMQADWLHAALSVPIWLLVWIEYEREDENRAAWLAPLCTFVPLIAAAAQFVNRFSGASLLGVLMAFPLFATAASLVGRLKYMGATRLAGQSALGLGVLTYAGCILLGDMGITFAQEMILLGVYAGAIVLVSDPEPRKAGSEESLANMNWAYGALLMVSVVQRAGWVTLGEAGAAGNAPWIMAVLSGLLAAAGGLLGARIKSAVWGAAGWTLGSAAIAWYVAAAKTGDWYGSSHPAPLAESCVLVVLAAAFGVLTAGLKQVEGEWRVAEPMALITWVGIAGRLGVLALSAASIPVPAAQALVFTWGALSLGLCLAGGRYKNPPFTWVGLWAGVLSGTAFISLKSPSFESLQGLVVASVPVVDISALSLLLAASVAAAWAIIANGADREVTLGVFIPVQWLLSAAILMVIAQEPPLRQRFDASMTLSWVCYGAAILGIGLRQNWKVLRLGSLVVFFAAFVKAVFYDLVSLDPLVKIVTFLVGGLVMLGLGYLYGKLDSKPVQPVDPPSEDASIL